MMEKAIIFSGFGGQGALFAGQLLTYAGPGCWKKRDLDPLLWA